MKNYKLIYIKIQLLLLGLMTSCEMYLEPEPDNRLTTSDVLENPILAEGWLLKAYKQLPENYNFMLDIVSDDAQTNAIGISLGANAQQMNNGGWVSAANPISTWNQSYEMLLYLNTFLEHVDNIEWSYTSNIRNELYKQRLKAEAYALRAYYNFDILQSHAGYGMNGELLGFPIVDQVLNPTVDDVQLPRNTFAECVEFILNDLDRAIEGLPVKWDHQGNADSVSVIGPSYRNRINGLAARLIKARLAVLAASPAFEEANVVSWENTAKYAAEVISANGGIITSPDDPTFYLDRDSKEIIWYSSLIQNKSVWEVNNFPPSLFGRGQTNPTQELVDVFPMINGYPINHSNSEFDALNPYANRDPRLSAYVIYNGSNFKGSIINTYENAAGNGLGSNQDATLSGYYLKKFMHPGVDLNPGGTTNGAPHFYTYARMTEAYLIFAESANEFGGPSAEIEGYSVKQILNAIRSRAGITNSDYVDSITSKEDMRELIRNERRIELAFEGFRFWDIRRWELTDVMKNPVSGIRIDANGQSFNRFRLSDRNYEPFQVYGPIPLAETLKYNLVQNTGW